MPRTELYPAIEPYESGHLQVTQLHSVYWEECGNPDGVPVLFLHGGPGAGFSPGHRRFFDPTFYRIVLVDQRGAGRSAPYAEIQDNLIAADMLPIDILRCKLSFFGATRFDPRSDRWVRICMYQDAPFPHELLGAAP